MAYEVMEGFVFYKRNYFEKKDTKYTVVKCFEIDGDIVVVHRFYWRRWQRWEYTAQLLWELEIDLQSKRFYTK